MKSHHIIILTVILIVILTIATCSHLLVDSYGI